MGECLLALNETLESTNCSSTAYVRPASRCPHRGDDAWPSPVGLLLGIGAAFLGQVRCPLPHACRRMCSRRASPQILVIMYHYIRFHYCRNATRIQPQPRPYKFVEGVITHVCLPLPPLA